MVDQAKATPEKPEQRVPAALSAHATQRRADTWAHWVAMHWPEVKIAEGNVILARIAGRPRFQARACVTLGHLLPADVHVEAVLQSGDERIAMFSIATLRNGRYRYVANTAAGDGDVGREWTIRISPAREIARGLGLDPVVVPVELVSSEAIIRARAHPAMTRDNERLQEVAS